MKARRKGRKWMGEAWLSLGRDPEVIEVSTGHIPRSFVDEAGCPHRRAGRFIAVEIREVRRARAKRGK